MTDEPRRVRVRTEQDAAEASRSARELALAAGLGAADAVRVATAVSEIAVNQVKHARGGEVEVSATAQPPGVVVVATDAGPGIAELELALSDGWSSAGGLGLGLPGARRLMDEFEIASAAGAGTRVRMAKWLAPVAAAEALGEPLADWAVAGPEGPHEAVVTPHLAGLLLVVARRRIADLLRAEPASSPSPLVERVGARELAVAQFEARDGRLAWRAEAPASALLLRRSGGRSAAIARAPRLRTATLPVLRGDTVLLASFALASQPADAAAPLEQLAADAVAAAPPDATGALALAVRFARGSLERRA